MRGLVPFSGTWKCHELPARLARSQALGKMPLLPQSPGRSKGPPPPARAASWALAPPAQQVALGELTGPAGYRVPGRRRPRRRHRPPRRRPGRSRGIDCILRTSRNDPEAGNGLWLSLAAGTAFPAAGSDTARRRARAHIHTQDFLARTSVAIANQKK